MQKGDAIVLGAGMEGVSAALHLQARGREVTLIDRRGAAGLETSFGNAGLIERASYFPHLFPRDPKKLFLYALNLLPEAHYHFGSLLEIAPWLYRYYRESSAERAARHAAAIAPLIERCLIEHEALIQQAGAGALLRKIGWIKLYRTQRTLAAGIAEAERVRPFGMRFDVLDSAGVAAREPDLLQHIAGAVHFLDTASIDDPSRLAQAYAALFTSRGGRLLAGDARTLAQTGDKLWNVATCEGIVRAHDVVVALGPWSDEIFRPLGYNIPLGWKRGYHMHYAPRQGTKLRHPLLDADNGYVLAPMTKGIRLTTGAEFARRDAPATPVQIEKLEPVARELFPLAERADPAPWMGRRPCLPDMLPIICKAPRHEGLWFDFGHQHLGFTLGPASGRLLAEMITGEAPFTDPRPYSVDRFGG